MSSEPLSLIVWCRPDLQSDAIQVRIVRVDTGQPLRIQDSSFLLRIMTDAITGVERCLIRHIASGSEAYVQGGPNLRTFVKACLLNSDESAPDTSGE